MRHILFLANHRRLPEQRRQTLYAGNFDAQRALICFGSATKILQILAVFLIVPTTIWAATQWTAYRLGFQAQSEDPGLADILEAAGIARCRDAVLVIAVDRSAITPAIRLREHRTLRIGVQHLRARAVQRIALVEQDRLVDIGTERIAAQQCAAAIIFGDQIVPIIDETRDAGARAVALV